MSDNNKADVPDEDFEIQTFDSAQQDELISVADTEVDASMAYIQQEYSDLSSKYQMVLQMLEEEQKQRAKTQQEHENRERLLLEELETLRQQSNEFSAASNSTVDADSKLEKLKVLLGHFLIDGYRRRQHGYDGFGRTQQFLGNSVKTSSFQFEY